MGTIQGFRFAFFLLWLVAELATAAPLTEANSNWNVNRKEKVTTPSRYEGNWPDHSYFPSPEDWRNVPVYQFITDRLRDGDPTNNERRYGGYDLRYVDTRHGGDFKGIEQSLAYIKSLGFEAIWISPIFQNRTNSYHGYGQIDFTLLDERFGTLEDFRSMVNKAHQMGMYVIVDIVVNHMDNLYYFNGHKDGATPFHMHDAEYPMILRNENESYADFSANNQWDPNGTFGSVYGDDGNKIDDPGRGSYSFSDFHHNGDLRDNWGDPWANHLGKIYGSLDDLRTTHPDVQKKIIAMTQSLIASTDIDGIRMDTPMQVPLYFFKNWAPAVRSYARALGKKDFFIFGEFFCGRPRAATMIGRGKTPAMANQDSFIDGEATMNAGINYRFYFDFVDTAIKRQANGLQNGWDQLMQDFSTYDLYSPAHQEVRYQMLNFINNHDQWRLNFEKDGFRKTQLGSAIIAFWPGLPLFYYGDEQGMSSKGSAVYGPSREDFMTSKAWYDVESSVSPNPASLGDHFNMTHPSYLYVQKLMNVRRQYYALRTANDIEKKWVQKDNTNGIFAFTRKWADQKNWAFVAFNTYSQPLEAGGQNGRLLPGWNEGDWIVNAMNPSERYRIERDGILPSLWLQGYETKVFVRADNLQSLNPVVEKMEPAHDQKLSVGHQEIRIRFSESMLGNSLVGNVLYDGHPVEVESLTTADDGKEIRFRVAVDAGIHKVRVLQQTRSTNGKTLIADFESRFRAGSSGNPILSLQKEDLEDPSLIKWVGAGRDKKLAFHHKADGAKFYRVSFNDGTSWSPWMDYASETQLTAPDDPLVNLKVQYWADGSAAYFVKAKVERP